MIVAVAVAGWCVDAASASAGTVARGGVPTTALRLLTGVASIERADPATVVFTAKVPGPTYWELGMLTDYRNGAWLPSADTADAVQGDGAPVAAPVVLSGSSAGTLAADVTLGSLSGRLVPVPPDTIDVEAPFAVVRTAGGAIAPSGIGPHAHYRATALVPQPPNAVPGVSTTALPAALAEDLALPPLPPVVHTLATTVTAVAHDPFSKTALLENWFRSGSFHYVLTPPPASTGADGLVDFLTTSRVGNCEQFAGAFAVMARSIGLPTRIAVGFTSGTRGRNGSYVVRGVDAHSWPEVYLGPTLGWVSFEPTPSLPAGELTPTDVIGPTGVTIAPPVTTVTPATAPPPPTLPTVPVTPPATSGTLPNALPPGSSAPTAASPSSLPWVVLAVTLLVSLVALVLWRRRRRPSRRSMDAPASGRDEALALWMSTEAALRRAGLHRPAGRSPSGWAAQLLAQLATPAPPLVPADERDQARAVLRDVASVAAVLEQALFAADRPDERSLSDADAAVHRVRQAVGQPEVRRRLLDAQRFSASDRRLARR